MLTTNRRKFAALVLPLALFVAACGSDGGSDTSSKADSTKTTMADDTATTMADNSSTDTMAAPEGDGCAAVPKTGKGSFDGMAQDPVATAASNNPALSTLVTAVTEADLGDTLNTGGPFTIFAPTDDAFAKLPADTLKAVLADKDQLTAILTYHVIPQRIEPADLGGTYKTVNGAEVTVSGDAPSFTVGADKANVVCSGVQTANATVYLVDSVLMPPAS